MNRRDHLTSEEQSLVARINAAYESYRFPAGPLRHRRPVRLWLASLAAVSAAVVVGAIVLQPRSALATWTSEPTSSELPALTDATEDACREQAATRLGVGTRAGWPDDPTMRDMARLPRVAHDQRGEASAALFADVDSGTMAICVIIPVAGQPDEVELTGGTGGIPEDFGSVSVWMAAGGSNWDYGSRWEIGGRVAADVDELVIVRADGERVTATIDGGWFLAWWPSSSHAAQLQITTGDDVQTVELGDRYNLGGPPCRVGVPFLGDFCIWSY